MILQEGVKEALKRIKEVARTKAVELDLSNLKLAEVPESLLTCEWLTKLRISNNHIQIIKNLPINLQWLDMGDNRITNIKNLPPHITWLDLSENQIEDIENLPDRLLWLYLSNNKIKSIKNLPSSLLTLSLRNNKIVNVNNLSVNLRKVFLYGNPTKNVPEIFLSQYDYNNCVEVVQWIANLNQGSVDNTTVRLMLTGNGNVGKTSIIEYLKNGHSSTSQPSTHGIRISQITIKNEDQPLFLQVFDFGGQEIYYGTHRLFLESRAIQLIVFDALTESLDVTYDRITGEIIRNQQLSYWINNILQISPQSLTILCQNKSDEDTKLPAATQEFINSWSDDQGVFIKVSAWSGTGLRALIGYLIEAAEQLPEYKMKIPKSWYEVQRFFLDNLQKPVEQRERIVSQKRFNNLCRRNGVLSNSRAALIHYLRYTGTIYQAIEYLGNTIIADQQWAIDAIYKALDRSGDLYDQLRNLSFGRCRAKQILNAFGSDYTNSQRWLFISFMESCGVCFPLLNDNQTTQAEETYYIFPEFLPTDCPESVQDYLKQSNNETFSKQFEFLPYYHVQNLIASWGTKADIRDIWRTGLRVSTQEGKFVFEANLKSNILTLKTDRTMSKNLLNYLYEQFLSDITQWRNPVSLYNKRKLSRQQFLANNDEIFEDNRILFKQISSSAKQIQYNKRTISLESLPDIKQHRPKEIVVSYAWQDEQFVEVMRKKIAPYKDQVILWYDRKLSSRQAWEHEIEERFSKAEGFIIFLSDDYLDTELKFFIHEKELPVINNRFQHSNGNLPVIIIRVGHCKPTHIKLLSDYLMFDKGSIMPRPTKDADAASEFLQKFVDEWLFKDFLQ